MWTSLKRLFFRRPEIAGPVDPERVWRERLEASIGEEGALQIWRRSLYTRFKAGQFLERGPAGYRSSDYFKLPDPSWGDGCLSGLRNIAEQLV